MNSLVNWLTACGSYVCSTLSYTMGSNLFLGMLPGTPHSCVSLLATGGMRPIGPTEYSSLQVVVRDPSPLEGMTRVTSIHALFDDKWCALSPTYQGRFIANHEPGAHILDENGHVLYSLNYTFTRIRQ